MQMARYLFFNRLVEEREGALRKLEHKLKERAPKGWYDLPNDGMAGSDAPLCLVATAGMADRYAAALTTLGIDFDTADAEDAVRNGLFAMAARIWPERELLETDA